MNVILSDFFTGTKTTGITIWKVWQNLYSCEYFKPYNNLMIIIDIIYKFAGLNIPGVICRNCYET